MSLDLTPREQKVTELRGKGYLNKRIAAECGVSEDAVESCIKNINKKARRAGYVWARVLIKVEPNGR